MAIISTTERVRMVGLPGEEQKLHVFFSTSEHPFGSRPMSIPGTFKVQFLLSRPGRLSSGEETPSFIDSMIGDSHIRIAKSVDQRTGSNDVLGLTLIGNGDGWSIPFNCLVNEKGCVGKIIVEQLKAQDHLNAEMVAYRALTPFLSSWSCTLDIPIQIETIQVTDLTTHTVSLRIRQPYIEMMPGGGVGPKLTEEYCKFSSLYREAMNATSTFYRFLCFHKLIESFYFRRQKLAAEARSRGEEARVYHEEIPLTEEAIRGIIHWIYPWRPALDEDFLIQESLPEEAKGKKFRRTFQTLLDPLRDTIAHGFMESGDIETISDRLEDMENAARWLPLLRIWVRVLFATEFPSEFAIGASRPSVP